MIESDKLSREQLNIPCGSCFFSCGGPRGIKRMSGEASVSSRQDLLAVKPTPNPASQHREGHRARHVYQLFAKLASHHVLYGQRLIHTPQEAWRHYNQGEKRKAAWDHACEKRKQAPTLLSEERKQQAKDTRPQKLAGEHGTVTTCQRYWRRLQGARRRLSCPSRGWTIEKRRGRQRSLNVPSCESKSDQTD